MHKVNVLSEMLKDNVEVYCNNEGAAGYEYGRNTNASKTALLNQITTLRNELLVLAEEIKSY